MDGLQHILICIITSNLFISGECCIPKIPFSSFYEASFDYDLIILNKTGQIVAELSKKWLKIAESHRGDLKKLLIIVNQEAWPWGKLFWSDLEILTDFQHVMHFGQ